MKKNAFLIFILILLSTLNKVLSQDTVYWSPCYQLKYEDFKGKPDTTKIDWANSYIQIDYSYNVVNNQLQFKINCYFLKRKSWAKNKLSVLMEHEQAHFDIAKLYALKLEKKFKCYRLTAAPEYDLKVIYDSIVKERLVMDKLYDKIEKENPTTDVPQKKFESDIKKQLPSCKKNEAQK